MNAIIGDLIKESSPVDTLITAELPEVNEMQSISGIKSAHSPLQSHSKEASAQKR